MMRVFGMLIPTTRCRAILVALSAGSCRPDGRAASRAGEVLLNKGLAACDLMRGAA